MPTAKKRLIIPLPNLLCQDFWVCCKRNSHNALAKAPSHLAPENAVQGLTEQAGLQFDLDIHTGR